LDQLKGINVLLSADEHCIGRCVEDRFQISDPQISSTHCRIYKDTVLGELNRHEPVPVFLKDTRFFFFWIFLYLPVSFPFLSFLELISCVSAAQMALMSTGKGSRKIHPQSSLIMATLYHL